MSYGSLPCLLVEAVHGLGRSLGWSLSDLDLPWVHSLYSGDPVLGGVCGEYGVVVGLVREGRRRVYGVEYLLDPGFQPVAFLDVGYEEARLYEGSWPPSGASRRPSV